MPARPDRPRDSPLVWAIAAAPALMLLVFVVTPPLRNRLLHGAVEQASVVATPEHRTRPVPSGMAEEGRVLVGIPSRPPESTPAPVADERQSGEERTQPDPARVFTTGPELDAFLESSYRAKLAPGVGPLQASIGNGRFRLSSELDFEQLRSALRAELPGPLAALVTGKAAVELEGRMVKASGGVAAIRIEALRIASLPVPVPILEMFMRGELEARGLVIEDPLVRRVFLPEGFESGAIQGEQLELRRSER